MSDEKHPPDFKSAKPQDMDVQQATAVIVTDQRGHRWSWNLGHTFEIDAKKYGEINNIIHKLVVNHNSSRKIDRWYLVANADSAFPPHALIQADDLSDALDQYYEECESWIKIDDNILDDYLKEGKTDKSDRESYSDHVHWTSNGVPVDTEQVVATEVVEIMIIAARKPE